MNLKIYDASWLIHYGSTSKKYGTYSYAGYSLGGLKFLVSNIAYDLFSGFHIVVCFDSKTDRSLKLEGYKSHRPFQAHIVSQMNFAYNMLRKSGICCLKIDNCEADDLIFNVVRYAKDVYDRVTIVSNDKDLAHNVDATVSLEACASGGIDISKRNFSTSITNKTEVLFNTVSAYKVFTGDSSDSIKSFRTESGIWGRELYKQYAEVLTHIMNNADPENPAIDTSHRSFLDVFIANYTGFSAKDRELLSLRADVIYPKSVDFEIEATKVSTVDKVGFSKLLTIVDDKMQLSKLNLTSTKLTVDEFNEFKQSAGALKDNSFAIENDCPLDAHVDITQGFSITNMRSF